MEERNFQPHKYYSRLNPHMLQYLTSEHFSQRQMKVLLHLSHIMTRKNLAQCPKDMTMITHLSKALNIETQNLRKILKPMKALEVYIVETAKAWRINPFIVNKVAFLPSIYGFSNVSKLTQGFAEWIMTSSGSSHVACESYQTLVKGQDICEIKKGDEMAELLKKMHSMEISYNKDMSLVTEKLLNVENNLALVLETLKKMGTRYDDSEAKELVRHLTIIK